MLKTMNWATRREERRKTQAQEELARKADHTQRSKVRLPPWRLWVEGRKQAVWRRRPSREQSQEAASPVHTELRLPEAIPPKGSPGNCGDHIRTPERGLITAVLWSEGLVLGQSRRTRTPHGYGDSQGGARTAAQITG